MKSLSLYTHSTDKITNQSNEFLIVPLCFFAKTPNDIFLYK